MILRKVGKRTVGGGDRSDGRAGVSGARRIVLRRAEDLSNRASTMRPCLKTNDFADLDHGDLMRDECDRSTEAAFGIFHLSRQQFASAYPSSIMCAVGKRPDMRFV
ncbi:hypothetical protein [Pararhizobium qamdonense]|uniref:hypothetical protein n=1 Tax=Pararhizobium qamdonense TaxID=3031126 RepID=UPI0023E2E848|nr:hypothetical protein [Pararhizobium qamdonense]